MPRPLLFSAGRKRRLSAVHFGKQSFRRHCMRHTGDDWTAFDNPKKLRLRTTGLSSMRVIATGMTFALKLQAVGRFTRMRASFSELLCATSRSAKNVRSSFAELKNQRSHTPEVLRFLTESAASLARCSTPTNYSCELASCFRNFLSITRSRFFWLMGLARIYYTDSRSRARR